MQLLAGGRSLYYDDGGLPKFPFYWTETPACLDAMSKDRLDFDSRRGGGRA